MKLLAASVVLLAVAAFLLSCAGMPQGTQSADRFQAHLSAAKDSQSQAQGEATFQLSSDGTSLSYTISVSNLANVTMAHIHVSSAAGQPGDVAAWLYPGKPPMALKEGIFNGVLAQGTITAGNLEGPLSNASISDLVDRIKAGLAYVNVHTNQYPGGEIQGTIVPAAASAGSAPKAHAY